MIDFDEIYEDMRPYRDSEAGDALKRILERPEFGYTLEYVFPDRSKEASLEYMGNAKSVSDFQKMFSGPAVGSVLDQTADGFTFSGLENIKPDVPYLFISNHRDIVLDSAILQYVLLDHGYKTTQITFGSNLMSNQFLIDVGKMNKMFTFYRGGSRVDVYRNALTHSAYIKKVITEEQESIWIAQRDGRSKDGDDQTQVSLLKMLTIKAKDHVEALQQVNIVPVTISYEIEPCDVYKVRETILASKTKYVKAEDEDFHSVLNGILGKKGKVHLSFGKPINEFIEANRLKLNNDNVHQKVCDEMDRQILMNYHLTKFNYASYDILNMSQKYLGTKYTEDEMDIVMNHIESRVKGVTDVDPQELKDGLIKLYTMPLVNALKEK